MKTATAAPDGPPPGGPPEEEYILRPGRHYPVPGQVIGEFIEGLKRDRMGPDGLPGIVSPIEVLEEAKNTACPVHCCYDWDNDVAGHEWRLDQARKMITSYYVKVVYSKGKPADPLTAKVVYDESRWVPGNVCVNVQRSGLSMFTSPLRAMADDEYGEVVLADIGRMTNGLIDKLMAMHWIRDRTKRAAKAVHDAIIDELEALRKRREKKGSKKPPKKKPDDPKDES